MSVSNLTDKLTEMEKRIKELEAQVKKYYAEKRDDTYRKDMEQDGKIDIQNISRSMAVQMIKSFEQNYDIQGTKDIEDLRLRVGSKDPRVVKYDNLKKIYFELKERFNL